LNSIGTVAESQGADPCCLSISSCGKFLLCANYSSGNISVLALLPDRSLDPNCREMKQHVGASINQYRQLGPHAHSIVPRGNWVLVADLGVDSIFVYLLDDHTGKLTEKFMLKVEPGSGPRDIIFHPNGKLFFTTNELNNSISAISFNESDGTLAVIQTRPTLPSNFTGVSYLGDIHLSSCGKFLLATNRGHDSIAQFSVNVENDGAPLSEYLGLTPTLGSFPRGFWIDPSDSFVVVGNQESHSLESFHRNTVTGELKHRHSLTVPSPSVIKSSN